MNGCIRCRRCALAVLLAHAVLLAWIDIRNSPVSDEVAHLAAGVSIWQFGRFDIYRVNPPLVRSIAALPVAYAGPHTDWDLYESKRSEITARIEWSVGLGFLRANLSRAMIYFVLARWTCIPLSILGGYFCWRWASELYGDGAGMTALLMWCFSPDVLAWGATICPDLSAASLGVTANYCFWRWLRKPDGLETLVAGIALGLALLTKMTWILLFALWPIIWLSWWQLRSIGAKGIPSCLIKLVALLLIGISVLNIGYLFEGTFTRLGDVLFVSRTLAADDSVVDGGRGGNRFAESWLGNVRIPVPINYLRGIDIQKLDFEKGLPSYLHGQWSDRGWWYFYPMCAALKIPLGTWGLALLALATSLWHLGRGIEDERHPNDSVTNTITVNWMDEFVLLAPGIVLFVLVSSQTGFSRHFRYALPALPFFFVWISKVARTFTAQLRPVGVLALGALTWSVASSLWIFPHSMSYFNEIAGGPMNGHRYLLDSSLDWGQDLFYLRDWCENHPEAAPLHTVFRTSASEDLFDFCRGHRDRAPLDSGTSGLPLAQSQNKLPGMDPGWYAVSVARIYDPDGQHRGFSELIPVAMAGYSFRLYHIEAATPESLVPVPH